MAAIPKKTLEIITRHKGEKIYAICQSDEKMSMIIGSLAGVQGTNVFIRERTNNKLIELSLLSTGKQRLFHLYNTNYIDLVFARMTTPLSKKIADRKMQSQILKNLKKKLNQDLLFVFKTTEDLHFSCGKFKDMRIMDIVLSLRPFYHKDENLLYTSVLHIYSPDGEDLINV